MISQLDPIFSEKGETKILKPLCHPVKNSNLSLQMPHICLKPELLKETYIANPYVQAFYALPFPCLLLELRGQNFVITNANPKFCDLFGISREEIILKKYPFYSEDANEEEKKREQRLESLRKVCRTRETDKYTLPHYLFLGSQKSKKRSRSLTIKNIPIIDEGGDVALILQLAVDKSEDLPDNKEAQKQLTVNHQEYENFVRKNKDGLFSLDREGNFLSLNEGLCKLTELPQKELLKLNFLPFCVPQHRKSTQEHFQKALQGDNQVFEAEFISAKGNVLVLEISLIPMKVDGKISGAYGIAKDKTPVKELEREISRNERKFQALVHEGSDLVGILEPDGTYKFVSDTSKKVLGLNPDYFIGKNAFDFIHPDDKEKVMADFSRLGNEKQVKVSLFRFRDAEGAWRWMETLVTNMLDEPHVEGIVTNTREVTELMQKTEKIKQLYERYTLAAEATDDVIYDWDLSTNEVIRFHKTNEFLLGYSREEIQSPTFWKSNIHPEDLPEVLENLKRNLDDPDQRHIRSQYRFRRADGSYVQIIDRSSILRDENGVATRLIGATIDISEILSNKEALKMANKRFSYAMRATKEIIWDWDIIKGTIKRSGSFRKIFGYSTSKSPSMQDFWLEKIVQKDRERVKKSLRSALDDTAVKKWREEYCFLRKNGEEAHVIDRGYILRNRQGKAIRMVGAVLDVTESRRMMEEIKKQNEVLKEVAWEQAHVVRAPLARLKGLLELLEEESYEEWSRDELVRLIRDSADEVDEIIGKIVRKTEKIGS